MNQHSRYTRASLRRPCMGRAPQLWVCRSVVMRVWCECRSVSHLFLRHGHTFAVGLLVIGTALAHPALGCVGLRAPTPPILWDTSSLFVGKTLCDRSVCWLRQLSFWCWVGAGGATLVVSAQAPRRSPRSLRPRVPRARLVTLPVPATTPRGPLPPLSGRS